MEAFIGLKSLVSNKFFNSRTTTKNRFIFSKANFTEEKKFSKRKSFFSISMKNVNNNDLEIWEIDFFSRPVLNPSGKRLWELIIVNKNETFEHVESIPNNLINSKELRKRIRQQIDSVKTKPKIIKFFRSQMFNMINIALSELDVTIKPSRKTYSLFNKIKEREETVYPNMEGYKPFMREFQSYQNLKKTPERMPDALRGEKYLFASIGGSGIKQILNQNPSFYDSYISSEKMSLEKNLPGIIIFSERSRSLSSWLDNIELYKIDCDIEQKNLCLDCGLDTQYLFARLSDDQLKEAKIFEEEKKNFKRPSFYCHSKIYRKKRG
mmetsp:Transcript_18724/g.38053  ORF Transcript_18724/g.38053 Transcript_18724/m.38053 type:complete len:323 (-) Transcript_18724:1807-2775(-)